MRAARWASKALSSAGLGLVVGLVACGPCWATVGPLGSATSGVYASGTRYAWQVLEGGAARGVVRVGAGGMTRAVVATLAPVAVKAVLRSSLWGIAAAGAWYLASDVAEWAKGRTTLMGGIPGIVIEDPNNPDNLLIQQNGGWSYDYPRPVPWPLTGSTRNLFVATLDPLPAGCSGYSAALLGARDPYKLANQAPAGTMCFDSGTWGYMTGTGWKGLWQQFYYAADCQANCVSCPPTKSQRAWWEVGCGATPIPANRAMLETDIEQLIEQALPPVPGVVSVEVEAITPELLEAPLGDIVPEWAQQQPEAWQDAKDAMKEGLEDAIPGAITEAEELTPEEYLGTTTYSPDKDLEDIRAEVEELPARIDANQRLLEAEKEAALSSVGDPESPTFDAEVTAPEKRDLGTMLSAKRSLLQNLPWVGLLTGVQLQASGSPTLSAVVMGRTIQVDFSKYETQFQVMGSVLLTLTFFLWGRRLLIGEG